MIPQLLAGSSTGWTDALLAGLLGFAIRATVVLAGAWLVTHALRSASAATRHLIWSSAIAGVLALPVLGVIVPAWNVPLISLAATVDAPLTSAMPPAALAPQAAPVAAIPNVPAPRDPAAPSNGANDAAGYTASAAAVARHLSIQNILAALWLVFAGLLLARLTVANARVAAWQRSSRQVEDGRWLGLLRRLSRQYGIERPVVLLENRDTDIPVTWGVVYPVVLLPTSAEQWDEEQRIAVLTHELAHVKRFDALTQLLAQVAVALLWFHPLVWVAVRRMRLEREHACDDFVLVAGARASRYADDLLGLARRLTRPTAPAAAALAMARRSELEGRLLAILDPGTKRTTVRRTRVGLITLAVIVLAIPLAAFRPAARVRTESKAPPREAGAEHKSVTVTLSDTFVAPREKLEQMKIGLSGLASETDLLGTLSERLDVTPSAALPWNAALPAVPRSRPDTEPPKYVDLETLIEVTKAARRMTSDNEKGQLLALIAKRYQRSDALRDAYLDAVFTMTSDHERSQAMIALLDRDSLPLSAVAKVLRSTAMMTSDMNKGMVLKRISPAVFADSAVQRAYLDAIVAMTSDMERASAITNLLKQRPLTQAMQLALLQAMVPMTSNVEKAGVLMLFLDNQGIADESVRRAFFKVAETLTSDNDYRRIMTAVMK